MAPILNEDLDRKMRCAARHEPGHIVVAAVQGLRLRVEGIGLDRSGEGLACYCKQSDGSDATTLKIIVATFGGFFAERRYREEQGYQTREAEDWFNNSLDGDDANELIEQLSPASLPNGDVLSLYRRTEELVQRHWLAIEALAGALLNKEWEPLKPLRSGSVWSYQTMARYLPGEEIVALLQSRGISAFCVADC